MLDSEGNLIACQMRDDLLKMGYYEIRLVHPSLYDGNGCLDLINFVNKIIKFWKEHGFNCKEKVVGGGECGCLKNIVISLP